jgi:hypothetical protein
MVWKSRLNRWNRRGRCRWSCGSHWRRRNVERNSRLEERVQLIQVRLPRLLGLGRRGRVRNLIILIGWEILIGRFTEEGVPVRAVEIGELGWIGHNSCKPIIEGHMKPRSDGSGLEIQD